VIQAAQKRIAELGEDRKKIDEELEFYKKDTSKAPGAVRRKLEDNTQSVAVQNRFIAEQEEEKKRVNARFDEERARLKPLWSPPERRHTSRTLNLTGAAMAPGFVFSISPAWLSAVR
jgi:predicted RNase H-like nuclease (RuvC/YqgF family)